MSFPSHRVPILTLNLRNNSLEYLFAFFVHFVLDLWLFMTMSNGLTKLRLKQKKKKGGKPGTQYILSILLGISPYNVAIG